MTSGKQARRRRQAAAAPPPVQRKGERRRASPKVLVGAALALVLIVVGVVAALALSGGSSSSAKTPTRGSLTNALPNAADAQHLFAGIPQSGNVLGSPNAPVTLVEYIDLQCPVCREFESAVMPDIVDRYVRTGKLKIEARPILAIGPDSVKGQRAAIAAGRQNRLFNFMQVVYYNQLTENSGWLNAGFVKKAAASIPGLDVTQFARDLNSSAVVQQAKRFDAEATADNLRFTPLLLVGKTGTKPRYVPIANGDDEATLVKAIKKALR
ncbi:MAG: thioredoxin domain-containing protein [Gaiellaceae bacterium]